MMTWQSGARLLWQVSSSTLYAALAYSLWTLISVSKEQLWQKFRGCQPLGLVFTLHFLNVAVSLKERKETKNPQLKP